MSESWTWMASFSILQGCHEPKKKFRHVEIKHVSKKIHLRSGDIHFQNVGSFQMMTQHKFNINESANWYLFHFFHFFQVPSPPQKKNLDHSASCLPTSKQHRWHSFGQGPWPWDQPLCRGHLRGCRGGSQGVGGWKDGKGQDATQGWKKGLETTVGNDCENWVGKKYPLKGVVRFGTLKLVWSEEKDVECIIVWFCFLMRKMYKSVFLKEEIQQHA